MFSPYVEEVSILLRFLSCLWLLMVFVVSCNSLILSLFLSSSRFFIISENSSGIFLLCVAMYASGFSLLCFFESLNSLCSIFSANSNSLFISFLGYPLWCRVVCSSLRRVSFLGLCVFYMLVCKGWILYSLWWWLLKWRYCWVSVGLW